MDCMQQGEEETGKMKKERNNWKEKMFVLLSSATRGSACKCFADRAASPYGALKNLWFLVSRSLWSEASPRNALGVVAVTPRIFAVALLILVLLLTTSVYAQIQPTAPDTMTNTSSQSPDASAGYAMTTDGGTITTVNINATTQNSHWKAYVGNVTGELALQDAGSNAVYDWNITSTEGEIYATRKETIVDWNSVVCANIAQIQAEETVLNMTTASEDSIANTFDKKQHEEFYAGLTQVESNSCNSTNLYVNSEESNDFEEVLLYDGSYMVYAALIENSLTGFDGSQYDFQMILPDSGLEGIQSPTTYYFYVELI